jgi:hypothetical protein
MLFADVLFKAASFYWEMCQKVNTFFRLAGRRRYDRQRIFAADATGDYYRPPQSAFSLPEGKSRFINSSSI